jgi:hypothetical protein
MKLLTQQNGWSLFVNCYDYLYHSVAVDRHVYGSMLSVERIITGTNMEVSLLLHGTSVWNAPVRASELSIETETGATKSVETTKLPSQVVLYGSSVLTVGVYRSLLLRCVKALSFALNGWLRDQQQQQQQTNGSNNVENEEAEKKTSKGSVGKSEGKDVQGHHKAGGGDCSVDVAVVPGGGANELSWAAVWDEVSDCAMNHGEVVDKTVASTLFSPVAALIASGVRQRLATTSPKRSINHAVTLCKMISNAYRSVAKVMLASCINDLDIDSLFAPNTGCYFAPTIPRTLLVWENLLKLQNARTGIIACSDPMSR